jgi:pimeloyl-ACP methyl ester carboxylesterase
LASCGTLAAECRRSAGPSTGAPRIANGRDLVVSLFADAAGSADRPAIVFLHGVAAAGWMWWRQVPAFPGHHCLSVDLPGHGRSRDIAWTGMADAADRVAEVIRQRTGTGRAHVVGLSLGGYVCLGLLARHPGIVERAVVSGVTVAPLTHRHMYAAQVRLTTALLRSRRLVDAQARALGLPAAARAAFAENVRLMEPRTYHRIAREVAGYTLPASLASARSPTLVLAGGRESDVIRRATEILPAVLPAAAGRLVPGVGHGWNVEAPELFNATVRAWIDDTPLPAGLAHAAQARHDRSAGGRRS